MKQLQFLLFLSLTLIHFHGYSKNEPACVKRWNVVRRGKSQGIRSTLIQAKTSKKIMVFAPHPDDDIIGCGGSIAKYVKDGNKVSIVYMTSGELGNRKYAQQDLIKLREQEAQEGARILGVDDIHFLKNKDGKLKNSNNVLSQVITILLAFNPHLIYIPHQLDGHLDHIQTHKIVIEALQEIKKKQCFKLQNNEITWEIPQIFGYEVWTPIQNVTYTENISDFIALKMSALQKHQSQLQLRKFDEAIKGLNLYRGLTKNKDHYNDHYAECFEIIKLAN